MKRENIKKGVELDRKLTEKEQAIQYLTKLRENPTEKYTVTITGGVGEAVPVEVGSRTADEILTLLHTTTYMQEQEIKKELESI